MPHRNINHFMLPSSPHVVHRNNKHRSAAVFAATSEAPRSGEASITLISFCKVASCAARRGQRGAAAPGAGSPAEEPRALPGDPGPGRGRDQGLMGTGPEGWGSPGDPGPGRGGPPKFTFKNLCWGRLHPPRRPTL